MKTNKQKIVERSNSNTVVINGYIKFVYNPYPSKFKNYYESGIESTICLVKR